MAQTACSFGSSPDLPVGHSSDATGGAAVKPDAVPEMLNDSYTFIEATERDLRSENTGVNSGLDGSAGVNKLIRTRSVFSRVLIAEDPLNLTNIDTSSYGGFDSNKDAQSVVNGHTNSLPDNTDSLPINTDTDVDRLYRDIAALSSGTNKTPIDRPVETRLTRNDVDIDQGDNALSNHVNGMRG